jgi:inhibitor of cysteine peptidase
MATVRLTEADSQRQVVVSSGDVVEVRLPENPTTGYRWHAEMEPPGGLLAEEDRMEAGVGGSQPGAGGTRVLSFRTGSPGVVRLRLKLRREWEAETPVQAQHEFSIEVK